MGRHGLNLSRNGWRALVCEKNEIGGACGKKGGHERWILGFRGET
jgi:phytoene dehydrogenase-like protein